MPVQWSIERLKPWTNTAESKLRNWMRASRVYDTFEQWRPVLASGAAAEAFRDPDMALGRVQERFTQMQENVKAKMGQQVFQRTTAWARQWLGADLLEMEISDGTISYWRTNHPHAEGTILFIHGFGDSKDGVYHMATQLVPQFNMIALDLPGFGASFKDPKFRYDNNNYGRWLEEFLVKLDAGLLHIVGNSLGGAMALKIALIRPDLVKSLTLLDTAFVVDTRYPSLYDEILKGKVLFQIKNREEFAKFWARVFAKEPMMPVFIKDLIYEQFRENHDWFGQMILEVFSGIKSRRDPAFKKIFLNEELKKLKVPTHVIWGEKDQLFPLSYGKKTHKLIKGSRFTVMKGIGHAPQVEAPRQTSKLIRRFVKEVDSGTFKP